MVGVVSLVVETWDNRTVRIITFTFLAICITGVVVAIACGCVSGWTNPEDACGPRALGAVALAVSVVCLALLYSDWILGAVAGNLAGVPSGDIAWLYWAYFISKRLPLFSI